MNRPNLYINNHQGVLPAESLRGNLIDGARNPFWLAPMAGITDVCAHASEQHEYNEELWLEKNDQLESMVM